jgi:hypothetical protein
VQEADAQRRVDGVGRIQALPRAFAPISPNTASAVQPTRGPAKASCLRTPSTPVRSPGACTVDMRRARVAANEREV